MLGKFGEKTNRVGRVLGDILISPKHSYSDLFIRQLSILSFLGGLAFLSVDVKVSVHSIIGFCLVLVFAILALVLYYRHAVSDEDRAYLNSPFEVISNETVLTLEDPNGERAKYRKKQICIVKAPQVTGYSVRNLFSDGEVSDIHAGPNATVFEKALNRGRVQLDILFHQPPQKGETIELNLELVFNRSFRNPQEYFTTVFPFPIRSFQLQVVFPSSRPPRSAWVTRTNEHGIETPLVSPGKGPSISGLIVTYRTENPAINSKHILHWEW